MPKAAVRVVAAATALLAACERGGGEVASCQDSLTGTWIRERGPVEHLGPGAGSLGADRAGAPAAASDRDRAGREERWAIVDHRNRLEIYPLFDDTAATAADDARAQLVRSPRSLELLRSRLSLLGHVERWVMRGGQKCVIRGSARISGCGSDERGAYLEAQLVELPVPATDEALAACLPGPRTLPRQAERWRRAE